MHILPYKSVNVKRQLHRLLAKTGRMHGSAVFTCPKLAFSKAHLRQTALSFQPAESSEFVQSPKVWRSIRSK
jgi:hypothetical protein